MIRFLFTCIIAILIFGLLIWQHFNGGVPSHHILQQKDLPEISNWWGAVLLPILAWIVSGRIEKRITNQGSTNQNQSLTIIGLFIAGLFLGILIALAFINNYKPFLDNVPYIFLLLSLFIPIFYSEFILGFILGMAYTFGTILPTVFILILSFLGFLIYRYIRPFILSLKKAVFK
jgi:uncharacterized protein YacL